jgi:hypothetical protein
VGLGVGAGVIVAFTVGEAVGLVVGLVVEAPEVLLEEEPVATALLGKT